jgi:hypothetical protein
VEHLLIGGFHPVKNDLQRGGLAKRSRNQRSRTLCFSVKRPTLRVFLAVAPGEPDVDTLAGIGVAEAKMGGGSTHGKEGSPSDRCAALREIPGAINAHGCA